MSGSDAQGIRKGSDAWSALVQPIAGTFLFIATAIVVWWQNSRLTVLYDLSGVLEPATRMAQGDIPYLDFPFPYAPLTFVMQAVLIRLFGNIYWHHIAYASFIAGLATVLSWRILVLLLSGRLPFPRTCSFALSVPLVLLGIYCIFPHPFYDPDACFVILLCLWLWLKAEKAGFPSALTFITGVLCVITLFIKQNIGLAFIGSIGLWLIFKLFVGLWRKETVKPFLTLAVGISVGLAAALTIIYFTCGVDNYKQWTITFATARRTPLFADMLSVYFDWTLPIWITCFLGGTWLIRKNVEAAAWRSALGVLLALIPYVWPVIFLLMDADPSERAERLVGLWPFTFITLLVLAYGFTRRLSGVVAGLPLILIATAHGVLLSQQLWGSTYGIWPLLMLLIGLLLVQLYDPLQDVRRWPVVMLCFVVSAMMLTAGGFYIHSNERLDYVNFEDGNMEYSKLPQLRGLSMRGEWITDFEELVEYTDKNIPKGDGVLYLPGEDLFFYTTGRHPHFPVLLFDVTNNPYDADEIASRVLASDIEWVIVKNDTQIEIDSTIDSKDVIFDKIESWFRNVATLKNYEIYKRRHQDDPPYDDNEDVSGGDDDNNNDKDDRE